MRKKYLKKLYFAVSSDHIEDMESLEARCEEFMANLTPEALRQYDDEFDPDERSYQVVNGTALYSINGPMRATGNFFTQVFGIASYDQIGNDLAMMSQDEEVNNVLISMSTPGGHVFGLSDLSESWRRLNESKPITVHSSGMIASGGMWLASNSHKIYASEVAEVGSIGVVMQHTSYAGSLQKDGIKVTEIKSAPLKHVGSPAFDLSAEEIEYLQKKVNDSDTIFKKQLYRTRPQIQEAAFTGGTFSAQEALNYGLIDGIKTYTEVFEELLASADNDETHYGGVQMKKRYVTKAMAAAAVEAGADPASLVIISQEEYDKHAEAGTLEIEDQELGVEEHTDDIPDDAGEGSEGPEASEETEEGPTVEEQLTEAQAQVADLTSQVEDLTDQLKVANQALELQATDEQFNQMKAIVVEGVARMRLGLGLQKVDMGDFPVASVLAEHSAVSAQFGKVFKTGGLTKPTVEKKEKKAPLTNSNIQANFDAVGVSG